MYIFGEVRSSYVSKQIGKLQNKIVLLLLLLLLLLSTLISWYTDTFYFYEVFQR